MDGRFNLWYRACFFHSPPPFKSSKRPKAEVIRAQPARPDRLRRVQRPAHFDNVLISSYPQKIRIHRTLSSRFNTFKMLKSNLLQGYRAGRVRAIFKLPSYLEKRFSHKLAYVEFFSGLSARPRDHPGLFTTSHRFTNGNSTCAVVSLSSVHMIYHLAPRYGTFRPEHRLTLQSDTLTPCKTFFNKNLVSYFIYELMRHWAQ